jgi:hypothetical protein
MIRIWLFLHYLGQVMWLGAGMAAMVYGIVGKKETGASRTASLRGQLAVHKILIGPGAFFIAFSGVFLSLRLYGGATSTGGPSVWLMVMQATGILGALIVLFFALPSMSRLARLGPGADDVLFEQLRRRHAAIATLSGTLGLLGLASAAFLRY